MGIKGIITLLVVGGIAGAGFYFKDNIKDAFATGKDKATNLKDKLQDGYQDGSNNENNQQVNPLPDNENNNKYNNGKGDSTTIVYVPIYQNSGQQSVQDGKENPNRNKSNPSITTYIKKDRKKTSSSISNTFSSPWARNNQESYAKQKYGIDYDLIKSGASKPESKRTIDEKKQIEGAKAREVFDSRSINNW